MDSSTQYVDERDATTQTLEEEQEQQDPSLEVATLANKFLHASYWFLVLGLTFSSAGLTDLARVARKRETSCLEAARNLLDTMKTPKLADILKPDWKAGDGLEESIRMMGQVQHPFYLPLLLLLTLLHPQVDGWLEKGVEELEAMVRERSGGSSLLERLLEELTLAVQGRLIGNRLCTRD